MKHADWLCDNGRCLSWRLSTLLWLQYGRVEQQESEMQRTTLQSG